MSDKLPAFQFYPGDWRKDPGVQSLDYEARGIWHELLCIMHESCERGRLVYESGEPIDDTGIAQILGIPEADWKQTRSKLLSRRVAGEDDAGALYNRRMCREEAVRKAKREAGRKGGKAKQKPSKPQAEGEAKRGSSSSSSSSKHFPLPQQAGESENGEEKPSPKNSRAHGTNPRAQGTNPRAQAARDRQQKIDEKDRQWQKDLEEAEANACTPEESLAAIAEIKANLKGQAQEQPVTVPETEEEPAQNPDDEMPF
ncbi:MAG: hypothetical protein ACYC5F_09655 [Thermoleophilia bacterium]